MNHTKRLIAITAFLLVFNIFLGGFAVLNQFRNRSIINNSRLENVLGVSTPVFSRHTVMSDETFQSTRAFPTQQSVQDYLDSRNAPIKDYVENGQLASYWIFSAARGITSSRWGVTPQINPGVILAYLEKEQSLISLSNYDTANDPQFRIRTAMGYGCPDGGSCADIYKGFANQVNWAAYQLQYNFNQAPGSGGGTQYRVGQTIQTLDNYSVYLSNAATAAQYRYTPHVYWGNYNLWKIIHGNGWGTDAQTYSLADIDAVNLPNKGNRDFDPANASTDTLSSISDLITTDIALGTQNSDISRIQLFLQSEGYFTFPSITGFYGVITESSIINYRIDNALNTGFREGTEETCTTLIQSQWTIGQTGGDTEALQTCLFDLGLFKEDQITGYFGPVTQTSLAAAIQSLDNQTIPDQEENQTPEDACQDLKSQRWKIGQQSDQVSALQKCLQDEGYYQWEFGITGYFGPYTQGVLADSLANSPIPQDSNSEENTIEIVQDPCTILIQQSWTIGQTGDDVEDLQDCLTASGHFSYEFGSTGYFGPVTQAALSASINTNNSSSSNTSTPSTSSTCQNLYNQSWTIGQSGDQVRSLQQCLLDDGHYDWPNGITGYFGPYTEGALSRAGGAASTGQSDDFSCESLKQQTWIIGERSTRVQRLQECMQSAGTFNYQYGATGFFGEVTRAALVQWRGFF